MVLITTLLTKLVNEVFWTKFWTWVQFPLAPPNLRKPKMLEKFLVVEKYLILLEDGTAEEQYCLVLKANKNNFVIVTRDSKDNCEIIRDSMLVILERIFNMRAFA